jgi:hypothetical protein
MNLVEQNSNFRYIYPSSFTSLKRIEKELEGNNIDVYFALIKKSERERYCSFIETIYDINYVLAGLADDKRLINNVKDLQEAAGNAPILTVFGSTIKDYINTLGLQRDDRAAKPK